MTLICGLILTLAYVLEACRGKKDLFSPRVIYNAYAWLKNVPYFLQVGANYGDELVFKYFMIKLIGLLMVNAGISLYKRNGQRAVYLYQDRADSLGKHGQRISLIVAYCMFAFGVAVKLYTIQSAGGLSYVLSHLQIRTQLLSGMGYFSTIAGTCLNAGLLYIEYDVLKRPTLGKQIVFAAVLLVDVALTLVFGARKPVLMLAVKVILCYHYTKRRLHLRDFFRPRFLVLIFVGVLFMVMMPMLRYTNTATAYNDMGAWLASGFEKIGSIFKELSYLSGDMYVFENFNTRNYWFGRSYVNIFVQWIPSSLYANKPPMDDGRYLYNMMQGVSVTPNMPNKQLPYQTSIPFTTEGALYSNFGILGVIVGCVLVGMLFQFAYKFAIDCHFSIYAMLIYQTIIMEFVPSVLHISSPLVSIVFCSLIMIPVFKIRIRRVSRKSQLQYARRRVTE